MEPEGSLPHSQDFSSASNNNSVQLNSGPYPEHRTVAAAASSAGVYAYIRLYTYIILIIHILLIYIIYP
jgi:hypothetical protein